MAAHIQINWLFQVIVNFNFYHDHDKEEKEKDNVDFLTD